MIKKLITEYFSFFVFGSIWIVFWASINTMPFEIYFFGENIIKSINSLRLSLALIISLVLITVIALITIIVPIFQFADFMGEVLKLMQGMIYEFEKGIEDFPQDKLYQDNEDETV